MTNTNMYNLATTLNNELKHIDPPLNQAINRFAEGSTLGDIAELDKPQLESAYTMAMRLFNAGSYQQAHDTFSALCFFSHNEKRYWFALGACRQQLKLYHEAIRAYICASMHDPHDPKPRLQQAICQLNIGANEVAEQCLSNLLVQRSEFEQDREIYAKAELLYQNLQTKAQNI